LVDSITGPIVEGLRSYPHLAVLVASLMPGVEPRYAVILGAALPGISVAESLAISVAGLLILSTSLSMGVSALDGFLEKIPERGSWASPVARLYRRVKLSGYKRARAGVERWGFLGLVAFIAVPLPFTGVYTGALASLLLGIRGYRLFAALVAGGLLSLALTTGALLIAGVT
jgi:uncharacterized membrane protein